MNQSREEKPITGLCSKHNAMSDCLKWGILVLIGCTLMSCSHWRDRYFDSGVDEFTQLDVREKFGKPHIVEKSLLDKKTTWVYRIAIPESELDPSGFKELGAGVAGFGDTVASLVGKGGEAGAPREPIVCLRYELMFDDDRVLREWTRQFCQLKKPDNPFERRAIR